jgi:hypothetical protein
MVFKYEKVLNGVWWTDFRSHGVCYLRWGDVPTDVKIYVFGYACHRCEYDLDLDNDYMGYVHWWEWKIDPLRARKSTKYEAGQTFDDIKKLLKIWILEVKVLIRCVWSHDGITKKVECGSKIRYPWLMRWKGFLYCR